MPEQAPRSMPQPEQPAAASAEAGVMMRGLARARQIGANARAKTSQLAYKTAMRLDSSEMPLGDAASISQTEIEDAPVEAQASEVRPEAAKPNRERVKGLFGTAAARLSRLSRQARSRDTSTSRSDSVSEASESDKNDEPIASKPDTAEPAGSRRQRAATRVASASRNAASKVKQHTGPVVSKAKERAQVGVEYSREHKALVGTAAGALALAAVYGAYKIHQHRERQAAAATPPEPEPEPEPTPVNEKERLYENAKHFMSKPDKKGNVYVGVKFDQEGMTVNTQLLDEMENPDRRLLITDVYGNEIYVHRGQIYFDLKNRNWDPTDPRYGLPRTSMRLGQGANLGELTIGQVSEIGGIPIGQIKSIEVFGRQLSKDRASSAAVRNVFNDDGGDRMVELDKDFRFKPVQSEASNTGSHGTRVRNAAGRVRRGLRAGLEAAREGRADTPTTNDEETTTDDD